MAELVKTRYPAREKFNRTVAGIRETLGERTFDSTLEIPPDPSDNWTLRITLRLYFRQINPFQLTSEIFRELAKTTGITVRSDTHVGKHPDSDGTPFFIKNWSGPKWSGFMNVVRAQAKMWNSKFWLMPPDSFGYFDDKSLSYFGTTFRPNVKCEFTLINAPSPSTAHGSVEVVNLLFPDAFRPSTQIFSTRDVVAPGQKGIDWQHKLVVTDSHPAIAHEIGHLLGLSHIGVSRGLGHCGLAMVMQRTMPEDDISVFYVGGSNSSACYGDFATAADINDIMGMGSKFGIENAKPWRDRLFHHLNLSASEMGSALADFAKWRVSLNDPPSRRVA